MSVSYVDKHIKAKIPVPAALVHKISVEGLHFSRKILHRVLVSYCALNESIQGVLNCIKLPECLKGLFILDNHISKVVLL